MKFDIQMFINDFSCLPELEIKMLRFHLSEVNFAGSILYLYGFCTQSSAIYTTPATFSTLSYPEITLDKKL